MTEAQKKDIIKSVVVLTVICLVISAALAIVNSITSPISQANAAAREQAARLAVIPDAADFRAMDTSMMNEDIASAVEALDAEGNTLGYIFSVNGKGFGGKISVMVAMNSEAVILNVQTLDVSGETKTLGGKVEKPEYTAQYAGQDRTLSGVDTISGATITSTAYQNCVAAAFEAFDAYKEAGV